MVTTQPALDLRHSEQVGDVRVRMVEALVRKQRGALAKIVPTTALASTSGQAERCLLASRFLIDMVVTSHDPKRPNFSENTDTHESLVIYRPPDRLSNPTTAFIALNRMPRSPEKMAEWVQAATQRWPHPCHQIHIWPPERINTGDWPASSEATKMLRSRS